MDDARSAFARSIPRTPWSDVSIFSTAQGERIVAEGFVVKSGRTLTIARGEGHAESTGRRTLVALMQQTLIAMHGKAAAPAA